MGSIEILRPVLVLAGWTAVMAVWMAASRLPALQKAGISPEDARDTAKLRDLLPPEVQRVANNYNHLFEQPTLFYTMAIVIATLGHVDELHVMCAWAFVVLRIVHSCVQATVDIVQIRFSLFVLCWIALAIIIARELIAAF